MAVDLAAYFKRIACFVAVVGIALPGRATALAELTVSAPGWDGADISRITLHGADSRLQLLVTETDAAGRITDQTRDAALTAKPSGLVRITDGLAEPLANGTGIITATTQAGGSATIPFEVREVTAERPVNFANSVVPLFTKHGCNSGGCHGKSTGQNGFKLSLLGFEPQEDYEYLLREARGRRIFPAAPERSLLLLKATGQLPHGGGSRIPAD